MGLVAKTILSGVFFAGVAYLIVRWSLRDGLTYAAPKPINPVRA